MLKYQPLKFNKTYVYPSWAYVLGWSLGLFCVFLVPLWMVFKVSTMKGPLVQVRPSGKTLCTSETTHAS